MFKKGDRVVRVIPDHAYEVLSVDSVYTVASTGKYLDGEQNIHLREHPYKTFDSKYFELESVYNSPLYKALS